ncbi:MAG: pyridoxamine 5'-phosphate oxidase [Anaerolineales bacterium]|nr:pyridoxamine 5'-phosphate oxidase [Anaerolineales bacterium]
MSETLDDLRRHIIETPMQRANLCPNPVEQFAQWWQQAEAAAQPQPQAMSLATADTAGRVSSRLVLLRAFDTRGFVFFSGYETKKGRDMAVNAQVALLFPWLLLQRQVRVEGTAVQLSAAESWQYFLTRSRASQVGAWLTQTDGVVSSRALLKSKWAEMMHRFQQGEIPLPTAWGGYRVQPQYLEFWQGHDDDLPDRFAYTRQADSSWVVARLLP